MTPSRMGPCCRGLWLVLPFVLCLGAQDANSRPATVSPPGDVAAPRARSFKTASGIRTIVLAPGTGTRHPSGDDCVVVRFTAWRRNGAIFASSGNEGGSTTQCLHTAIPGVAEVLKLMVDGEKRRAWVPADLAFATHIAHHGNKKVHADAPDRPALTFDLELVSILQAPPPPDDLKTPPASAIRTPSGVAIQVLEPGTGTRHPDMTSRVEVNYTGWTAQGALFETTTMSGHSAIILLGTALPGWREALPCMVEGEKARIWIPGQLAHGDHPLDLSVPAGDLVFDIELIRFE